MNAINSQEELPKVTRMFGIEMEFFLLDNEGKICNSADFFLEKLQKKLQITDLKQECGHSMIELTSFPHLSSRFVFSNFFEDFETLLYAVAREDKSLFYYGSYPGKNTTVMREDVRYSAKKNILGEEQFPYAGKCIGFHYHFSLPRNSFNDRIKFFYPDITPLSRKKVKNVYNAFIALDPVVTTLMQSSPFLEGTYLGKDSRMIAYRGDPLFEFSQSLYTNQPEFGMLNPYAKTFQEIIDTSKQRFDQWKSLLREHGVPFHEFIKKESSILDSSWKPVKISPHGTIESRGADMNAPSRIVGLSRMLNALAKYITAHAVEVVPGALGNEEPFTLEDGALHVPDTQQLREVLQMRSAIAGLDDKLVHRYCTRLLRFAKKNIPDPDSPSLALFSDMLEERKTASDMLLDLVRKKEGTDFKTLSDEAAQEIALKSAESLYKDVLIAKKISERSSVIG